jgi:uncharacterized protein YukE
MSGGFATQPDDLDAAARRFDEAADVAAQALAELRSTLAGLGDYLGADEQGRAFAARYDPAAADGLAALGHEAESLRSLGPALRQAAEAFRGDDAAGAAALRRPAPG